jgi:hypothetical protein
MAAESEGIFLHGGQGGDEIATFARAAAIMWTLTGADTATVQVTALPVDTEAQTAALGEIGFAIVPVRWWVRIFDNLLHARASATGPAEVERLLVLAAALVDSMLHQLDVDFPRDVRMTYRCYETIEVYATDRAMLARLVTDLIPELTPFAAGKQIELERSQ